MIIDKNFEPKVIHQGVDTLLTSHIIMNQSSYFEYERLLRYLSNYKDEAILKNKTFEFENGIAFDFKTLGKFHIMPKGMGRFKYILSNNDITLKFSTLKFGSNDFNSAQITVEYRSKFLSLLGHEKAYATVISLLNTLLSTDLEDLKLRSQLMRIDLCTDIAGIDYTPMDKYNFQTNFKNEGHTHFIEHMQYSRLTGFTFGKGDYMMRIYDKRLELNNNASKLWLTILWTQNGYLQDNKVSVWRHETQMRRPYLKRYKKENIDDEVLYFFNMLPKLWTFSFSKVQYVDLSQEQSLKVMNGILTPSALRQMFYRTKRDNESSIWNMCKKWDNLLHLPPKDYGQFKKLDNSVAKRFFKSYISTCYKYSDGDPFSVIEIMEKVQSELENEIGISIHDYASNKLLGDYIDNSQYITNYGFVVDNDYKHRALKVYLDLYENLSKIRVTDYERNTMRLAKLFGFTVDEFNNLSPNELLDLSSDYEAKKINTIYECEYVS